MNKITYTNKPVVKDWMSDGEKEFRGSIEDFIFEAVQQNSTLFSEEGMQVAFFQEGVASVVGLLTQKDKKYIFKTVFKPLRAEIEAAVFETWSKENIETPYVYAEGSISGFTYFIMEYVETPTYLEMITEHPERKMEILESTARLFFRIHEVKVSGFGPLKIIDGELQGSIGSLEEYLNTFTSIKLPRQISSELMDFCQATFLKHSDDAATIGHFDFGPHHIFSGPPPIVFDPDPEATLPAMDLGLFLLREVYRPEDLNENNRLIFKEYIKNLKEPINIDLLASALIFQTIKKAQSLLDRPDERRVQRAEHMLDQISTLDKTKEYLQMYL